MSAAGTEANRAERLSGRAALLLAAAIAVGAGLRFWGLERQSLWLDEFLAFFIGQQTFELLFHRAATVHGQLPFYYVVVKLWSALFGAGDAAVLRGLSASLGVLGLVQLGFFARRVAGPAIAVAAVWLLALSPYHLYMSQEARMYPLFTCLILGIAHLVWDLMDPETRGRAWRLALLAVLTALALYTHYFSVLFLAAMDLVVVLQWRRGRRPVIEIACAQIAGGLTFVPWLPHLLAAGSSGGASFFQYISLKGFYTAFVIVVGYSSVVIDSVAKADLVGHFLDHWPRIAAAGLAFGWLGFLGIRALWERNRTLVFLLLAIAVIPVSLATAVSYVLPIISDRYFAPAAPFVLLLVAAGVVRRPRAALPAALLAAVLVGDSLRTYTLDERFGYEEWQRAAVHVDATRRETDGFLFVPHFVDVCLQFYLAPAPVGQRLRTPADADALRPDRRYWLVASHSLGAEAPLLERLEARFRLADHLHLPKGEGIDVYLFEPRADKKAPAQTPAQPQEPTTRKAGT